MLLQLLNENGEPLATHQATVDPGNNLRDQLTREANNLIKIVSGKALILTAKLNEGTICRTMVRTGETKWFEVEIADPYLALQKAKELCPEIGYKQP